MAKTVSVTRAGVARIASWDDQNLYVNGEDMVELIEKEVEKERPKRGYAGEFAARITIAVELLGDVEVNLKTAEEIKKGLEVCSTGAGCIQCPYDEPNLCHGIENKADAIAYIQQLEKRNSKLEYTLLGVMHSIDKWLDVEPYDFDNDDGTVAATRASDAREVALKAIDKAQADLAQAERERDAAVHDLNAFALNSEKELACDFCGAASPLICQQCEERPDGFKWRGVCKENTNDQP